MRPLFSLLLLLTCLTSTAQVVNLDHLMTRRPVDCTDIVYNSKILAPHYYFTGKDDSIKLILDYWEQRCGISEETQRARTLLFLKEYKSIGKNEHLLDYMLQYKAHVRSRNQTRILYPDSIGDEYDNFTTTIASEAQTNFDSMSIEYLVCEFYKNNFSPFLNALKQGQFSGTFLQQSFAEMRNRLEQSNSSHVALVLEYWIPFENLKTLGNHPGIGLQFGFKFNKLSLDMAMIGRFVDSKNYYSVFDHDSMYHTNSYSGAYLGLDAGYTVIKKKQSEFNILGGISRDEFLVVDENKKTGQEKIHVGSLNLNAGLGYRYYYSPLRRYIGIQGKFNVLNYNTKGGTDLSGNAITVRLVAGINTNFYRDHIYTLLYK
jgi:hypothetical protein